MAYKRKKNTSKKKKGKMNINTKYPKTKKALNKKKGAIIARTPA
jgi:hypothetical protein|tara:strand:+ start:419 stop:550 length:132 start_codon:yes stop_codon:yes gene_type:complete